MGLARRTPSHRADRHLARQGGLTDLEGIVAERLASLEGRCLDCLDGRLRLVGPGDFTVDGVPLTAPIDPRAGRPRGCAAAHRAALRGRID